MAVQATSEEANVWTARIGQLADDVEAWASEQNWATHRADKLVEDLTGSHPLPFVRVRTPYGQLHLDPIGSEIVNAEARVDLEGWPTLHRVALIGDGGRWLIYNDPAGGGPHEWDRQAFLRLAADLLEAPRR